MGSQIFSLAALVVGGIIVADFLTHPSGTTAAANGLATITTPADPTQTPTALAVSEPREEDAEHVMWPFDGTYWKDELGGYTYDTKSRCTSNEMPKEGAKASKPKGKGGAALKKAGAAGADKAEPAADVAPVAPAAKTEVPAKAEPAKADWGDESAPKADTAPKTETP